MWFDGTGRWVGRCFERDGYYSQLCRTVGSTHSERNCDGRKSCWSQAVYPLRFHHDLRAGRDHVVARWGLYFPRPPFLLLSLADLAKNYRRDYQLSKTLHALGGVSGNQIERKSIQSCQTTEAGLYHHRYWMVVPNRNSTTSLRQNRLRHDHFKRRVNQRRSNAQRIHGFERYREIRSSNHCWSSDGKQNGFCVQYRHVTGGDFWYNGEIEWREGRADICKFFVRDNLESSGSMRFKKKNIADFES